MATIHKDLHNQATNFGEQTKDMASDVGNKAKDMGSAAAQKAGEAANYVGKKADDATCAMGAGIKSVAQTIRESTPDKGILGSASSAVADTLEQGGRYLQEQGLSGIGARHDQPYSPQSNTSAASWRRLRLSYGPRLTSSRS